LHIYVKYWKYNPISEAIVVPASIFPGQNKSGLLYQCGRYLFAQEKIEKMIPSIASISQFKVIYRMLGYASPLKKGSCTLTRVTIQQGLMKKVRGPAVYVEQAFPLAKFLFLLR
jgi:hypothetical protein